MLRTRNDFLTPTLKFLPIQARRRPELHKTASEMLPVWKDKDRIKSPIDYAQLDQEQQISDEALMKGVEDGDIEFDEERMDADMGEWERQQSGEVEFEDDEEDRAYKKKIAQDVSKYSFNGLGGWWRFDAAKRPISVDGWVGGWLGLGGFGVWKYCYIVTVNFFFGRGKFFWVWGLGFGFLGRKI